MGDVIDLAKARAARSARIRFQLDEEKLRVCMILEDPELGAVYAGLTQAGVLQVVEGLIEAGRQLHKAILARWSKHLAEVTGVEEDVFDGFARWWRNVRPNVVALRDVAPERARELVLEAAEHTVGQVFRRCDVGGARALVASRMLLAHLAFSDGTTLEPQTTCLISEGHAAVLWSEL
jgi:hypothetical protein